MDGPSNSQPETINPCRETSVDHPETLSGVTGAFVAGKINPTARNWSSGCAAIFSRIQRLVSFVGQNVFVLARAAFQVSKIFFVITRALVENPLAMAAFNKFGRCSRSRAAVARLAI